MKPLRNIVNAEQTAYMRQRKSQNLRQCKNSAAEAWAHEKLRQSGMKWTRQSIRGFRIYDFWASTIGCAVEIDGPEHDVAYDAYRDEYNFRRNAIVVLRVRNFSEEDIEEVLKIVRNLDQWPDRREAMGLHSCTKKERRALADQPYSGSADSMLAKFIESRRRG